MEDEEDGHTNGYHYEFPEKLRIAVLSSSYDESDSVFEKFDSPLASDMFIYGISPDKYDIDSILLTKRTALNVVRKLVLEKKYDAFICLCDGAKHDATAGIEVVEALIYLDVPFAGPTPEFYNLTKRQMKGIAAKIGMATAAYFFVDYESNNNNIIDYVQRCSDALNFPLIVKHHNGGGSEGMHDCNKVHTRDQLYQEVIRHVNSYGGALVEEFISGPEYTVLVVENPNDDSDPIVYHPFECNLGSLESFKTFERKFVDYSELQWTPVQSPEITEQLKQLTSKIFMATKGSFYARCDFRMCARTGKIYFLEINTVCGVFYTPEAYGSADYILRYSKSHRSFFNILIKLAFKAWHTRKFDRPVNQSLPPEVTFFKANKTLKPGSVALDLTMLPHRIVHKLSNFDTWPSAQRDSFMTSSVQVTKSARLLLEGDFLPIAFKRAPPEEVNCAVDTDQFRLISVKMIEKNEFLTLSYDS